jgi:hypothetical protein
MQHAITLLTAHAEACETNAAIREELGHTEQATLDRAVAADCRAAIEILRGSPLKQAPSHRIPHLDCVARHGSYIGIPR